MTGTHPVAPGRTWLVSDDEDVSTTALLRLIGTGLRRDARLWAVSPRALRVFAGALGRGAEIARLADNLQVNVAETKTALAWAPQLSLAAGVTQTASWFAESKRAAG